MSVSMPCVKQTGLFLSIAVSPARGFGNRRQTEGARTALATLVGGGSAAIVTLLQRDT
jgi:hypothetical protein